MGDGMVEGAAEGAAADPVEGRVEAGRRPARLGLLYPGQAAADDYPALAARISPRPDVQVVHTSVGEDAHRLDALIDLGGRERLAEGASRLGPVDAVVWACTSGSFVFGAQGARSQAAVLSDQLGVPASSTSLAFVEAARTLGLTRVAVAATYPAEVAEAFAAFLADSGIEVVSSSTQGIVTAAEVGLLGRARILAFVESGDHPDAEAVLVPDTALHSVAHVGELERRLRKPVLSANVVTMWEALRLVGALSPQAALGTLWSASALQAGEVQ